MVALNRLYVLFSENSVIWRHEPLPVSKNNRVFSHDVTAAILVSQNNDTAVMLVSQTNPLGVQLFSYANAFFCSNKFASMLAT